MRTQMLRKYLWCFASVAAAVLLFTAASAFAQDDTTYNNKGFTAFEQFRGSTSKAGQFFVLDTSIGYNFNNHVGLEVGEPVYFLRATNPGQRHSWDNNWGDPYVDLLLTFPNKVVNYDTIFTVSIPVQETGAFSTGRVGLDWFNHFDRPIYRLTPYVNAGIANGILNTHNLSQPSRLIQDFRTLGFIADLEGGATFRIWRSFGVGGSYYAFLPSGPEKVFPNQSLNNPFLVFNGRNLTDLTRDYGYTAYAKMFPAHFLYLEAGYAHSIRFDDDAATVTLGVDIKSLFRPPHGP